MSGSRISIKAMFKLGIGEALSPDYAATIND
jgi:hypothetical protein